MHTFLVDLITTAMLKSNEHKLTTAENYLGVADCRGVVGNSGEFEITTSEWKMALKKMLINNLF